MDVVLRRLVPALAAVALACSPLIPAAHATTGDTGPYAPLNCPGPALSVPAGRLAASLQCSTGVSGARRAPVLLVPGTTLDPEPNFDWNYERAFDAQHRPWCAVRLPEHATGDVQIAGEYVVYALRTMSARAHRKVDVLGYSQGGMLPRWALRFWPDTRRLVNDVVGLDPSNHGTVVADAACAQSCDAANYQQASRARFIAALNSGAETFRGIDYTVTYSRTDEIVVPNVDGASSSSLHTGDGRIANIAVQTICPGDPSEHLAMGTYDAVGYALAIDALDHAGPADPARVPVTVCAQPLQPGVDPAMFPQQYARYVQAIGQNSGSARMLPAEPPLKRYTLR